MRVVFELGYLLCTSLVIIAEKLCLKYCGMYPQYYNDEFIELWNEYARVIKLIYILNTIQVLILYFSIHKSFNSRLSP